MTESGEGSVALEVVPYEKTADIVSGMFASGEAKGFLYGQNAFDVRVNDEGEKVYKLNKPKAQVGWLRGGINARQADDLNNFARENETKLLLGGGFVASKFTKEDFDKYNGDLRSVADLLDSNTLYVFDYNARQPGNKKLGRQRVCLVLPSDKTEEFDDIFHKGLTDPNKIYGMLQNMFSSPENQMYFDRISEYVEKSIAETPFNRMVFGKDLLYEEKVVTNVYSRDQDGEYSIKPTTKSALKNAEA